LKSDKDANRAGRKEETLTQYHRPLVEDGELDYEFFYESGVTCVHPALDRLVMLIDPDGVNLHWVTDHDAISSGLLPGNVTTEKESRKGPEKLALKAGDWNQAKLKLAGR